MTTDNAICVRGKVCLQVISLNKVVCGDSKIDAASENRSVIIIFSYWCFIDINVVNNIRIFGFRMLFSGPGCLIGYIIILNRIPFGVAVLL